MTEKLIDRNPDILGGTPVFSGTRVPVRILMEHLEAGDRLDDFLDDYPTVTREQAVELLERATAQLVGRSRAADPPRYGLSEYDRLADDEESVPHTPRLCRCAVVPSCQPRDSV